MLIESLRKSIAPRAPWGTLYARAGISRLQPMYTGAFPVCFSSIGRRRTCHVEEDVGLGAVLRDRHSAFCGGGRLSREIQGRNRGHPRLERGGGPKIRRGP